MHLPGAHPAAPGSAWGPGWAREKENWRRPAYYSQLWLLLRPLCTWPCLSVLFVLLLGTSSLAYWYHQRTSRYYEELFELRLAHPFWHRYWDSRVVEARLLLTPLTGAKVWWQICPPFYPFGCMMTHPHVVLSIEDSGVYRTYEYHPDWPHFIKFMHGWGTFKRTDSPQWTPSYRLRSAARWIQLPVRGNVTIADVEQWNRQWCCVYSIFQSNCQHYVVDLMEFLTGERLNFWIYDTVPLPNFLFVLFIILQGLAVPALRQACFLLYYILTKLRLVRPFITFHEYFNFVKLDAVLLMVSVGCMVWFTALCTFEFQRQAAQVDRHLNGIDDWP